jgi:hypothetical protein
MDAPTEMRQRAALSDCLAAERTLLAWIRTGLALMGFSRRPATHSCRRRLRGLPVLVHEVSRRVWGLRLRRTEPELALSRRFMLPSAHSKDVGVRIASFRSGIPTPPILCLRFAVSLALAAQDSRPSGSVG